MQVLIAQSVIAVECNRLYIIKDRVFKSDLLSSQYVLLSKSIAFEQDKHNMIFIILVLSASMEFHHK